MNHTSFLRCRSLFLTTALVLTYLCPSQGAGRGGGPIRKRYNPSTTAKSAMRDPDMYHEHERMNMDMTETTFEFGRIRLMEEELEEDLLSSYSYEYSIDATSMSYSFSMSYGFAPVEEDGDEDDTLPSSSPVPQADTHLPSVSPTVQVTEMHTDAATKNTDTDDETLVPNISTSPTPLQIGSNDDTDAPTASPTNAVTSTTTSNPTPQPTVHLGSNDSPPPTKSPVIQSEISANNAEVTEVDTTAETTGSTQTEGLAILTAGLVTGAFVIGFAVRAIDRRNGPTEYLNLDGDSHSSFSLQA